MFSSFSFSFFFFSRRRGGKNGKSSVTYVVSFRIWSANCSRLPTFVPRQCRVGVTYVRPSQQPKHIFHINNKNDNNNLIQKLLLFPSALEKTSVALFHFPFSRRRRRRSEEKQATRKEKKNHLRNINDVQVHAQVRGCLFDLQSKRNLQLASRMQQRPQFGN